MYLINMFCDFFPECSHYHETSHGGGERGRSLTTLVANFRNLEHMIPAQHGTNCTTKTILGRKRKFRIRKVESGCASLMTNHILSFLLLKVICSVTV